MRYLEFFKKLNEQDIDYLIVGGLALIIYGSPRFTYDIDIVLALEDKNINKFISIITEFGYKVKIPVNPFDFAKKEIREDWLKNKNMKAFNFYNNDSNMPEIDVVIDTLDFNVLKTKKCEFIVDNVVLAVPSIQHLIEMKKIAGRKVDLEDIEYLKIIEKNNV